VTRTPAIRDGISASLSEMGLVLLGPMCGLIGAAKMVGLWGTRSVAIFGTALLLTGLIGVSGENGGAKFDHGSGGVMRLRAA